LAERAAGGAAAAGADKGGDADAGLYRRTRYNAPSTSWSATNGGGNAAGSDAGNTEADGIAAATSMARTMSAARAAPTRATSCSSADRASM